MAASPPSVVAAPELRAFAGELLRAAGMRSDHADEVAQVLVWADLRGTGSHGVSRLPLYLQWLRSGQMNGQADIRPRLQLPALTVLEGDRCAGVAGMQAAARTAISGAARAGMAMCLLRDTTHTGALGFYTSMVAEAGMLGIASAASGPHMAYHGAGAAGVSTAPLSIAAPGPAGGAPIVFDMASGVVALGKLQQAKAAGRPIPEGWALDAQGRPTTEAARAEILLPLGGPKGSGLALMAEILCSLLTDNPILAPALAVAPAKRRHYQNAMVLAVDVGQVIDFGAFQGQAAELVAAMRALPPQPGEQVRLPGERGDQQAGRRLREGIPLPESTLKALADLSASLGLTVPWPPG